MATQIKENTLVRRAQAILPSWFRRSSQLEEHIGAKPDKSKLPVVPLSSAEGLGYITSFKARSILDGAITHLIYLGRLVPVARADGRYSSFLFRSADVESIREEREKYLRSVIPGVELHIVSKQELADSDGKLLTSEQAALLVGVHSEKITAYTHAGKLKIYGIMSHKGSTGYSFIFERQEALRFKRKMVKSGPAALAAGQRRFTLEEVESSHGRLMLLKDAMKFAGLRKGPGAAHAAGKIIGLQGAPRLVFDSGRLEALSRSRVNSRFLGLRMFTPQEISDSSGAFITTKEVEHILCVGRAAVSAIVCKGGLTPSGIVFNNGLYAHPTYVFEMDRLRDYLLSPRPKQGRKHADQPALLERLNSKPMLDRKSALEIGLMTVSMACAYLGLSESAVLRRVQNGKLDPEGKIPSRGRRGCTFVFSRDEIEAHKKSI